MMDRNEAYEWIERLMDGEELPPEIEEFIRQDSLCLEYRSALERAVSALDRLQIPTPPPDLGDCVMNFIQKREEMEERRREIQNPPSRRSIWEDIGHTLLSFIPEFHIPTVLQREAVPIAISLCVVVWGILIAPQVQADKDNRLYHRMTTCADWMVQESDRISDGIYSKANGLIDRVTEVFRFDEKNVYSSPKNEAKP